MADDNVISFPRVTLPPSLNGGSGPFQPLDLFDSEPAPTAQLPAVDLTPPPAVAVPGVPDEPGVVPAAFANVPAGSSPARHGAGMGMLAVAAIAVAALRGTFHLAAWMKARAEHWKTVRDKAKGATSGAGKSVPPGPMSGLGKKAGGKAGGSGGSGGGRAPAMFRGTPPGRKPTGPTGAPPAAKQKPPTPAPKPTGKQPPNKAPTGPGAGPKPTAPRGSRGPKVSPPKNAGTGPGKRKTPDGKSPDGGKNPGGRSRKEGVGPGKSGSGTGPKSPASKKPGKKGTAVATTARDGLDPKKPKPKPKLKQRNPAVRPGTTAPKPTGVGGKPILNPPPGAKQLPPGGPKKPGADAPGPGGRPRSPKGGKGPKTSPTGRDRWERVKAKVRGSRRNDPRNGSGARPGAQQPPPGTSGPGPSHEPSGGFMRPPPGMSEGYTVTLTREPPPAPAPAGAITRGRAALPAGPGPGPQRRAPTGPSPAPASPSPNGVPMQRSSTPAVQPSADSDLTIYDLIEGAQESSIEILERMDQALAARRAAEQVHANLEYLKASVIQLKIPGVLVTFTNRLLEKAGSVAARAQSLAAKLPQASEAIATAGSNAAHRHKALADATRDAGHAAPAEADYHKE